MKSYFKFVLGAVFLGGILAFFFYRDIQNEVIAITTDKEYISVFQVGVFKSLENAQKFSEDYASSGIYADGDVYRVIIAVTQENVDKLSNYFTSLNIKFYIKEILMEEEIKDKIKNYDKVIAKTDKEEVLNKLNKSCVELFLKK